MTKGIHQLVDLWSAWTRILEDIVGRRRRVARLTEEDYQELHGNLLTELDKQIQRCKSVEHSVPKEMYRLVAPWITLDSLLAAERHVLTVLASQARRAGRRLDYRRSERKRWVMIAAPVIVAVLAGLLMTWLIGMWENGDIAQGLRQSQHWAYRLQRFITKASLLTKITVFALFILATGTFFLRSMRQD